MQQFTPVNSIVQDWRNLENVNQDNCRILDNNSSLELSAFYSIQPSICQSNVQFTSRANFGLVSSTSTTATFNWNSSTKIVIRFLDQSINGYSGLSNFSNTKQTIFATLTNPNSVITLTSGSGNNYVLAQLTLNPLDGYRAQASVTLLAYTGAIHVSNDFIALFALVSDGAGGLTTTIDSNCAYNYLIADQFPDIYDNSDDGNVNIGGRIAGSSNSLTTKDIGNTGVFANISTNMGGPSGTIAASMIITEPDGIAQNSGLQTIKDYVPHVLGNLNILGRMPSSIYTFRNIIRKYYDNGGICQLNMKALFDGQYWSVEISGRATLTNVGDYTYWAYNIPFTALGITKDIVTNSYGWGPATWDGAGDYTTVPRVITCGIVSQGDTNALNILLRFDTDVGSTTPPGAQFSILFTAANVTI